MNNPTNLPYSKEHTWLNVNGNIGTIGITAFAQSELGEIGFADLPHIGASFLQDHVFGSIEALKTVSDLFMPVSSNVIQTNSRLKETPALINDDPYNEGWLIQIEIQQPAEIETLLTAQQYNTLTNQ